MRIVTAILAALALFGTVPARADVAPLGPEGRDVMVKREWMETEARKRFGNEAVERASDWRQAFGAVMIAEEGKADKLQFLLKDEYGWYEVRPGQTKRVPLAVGQELNRLLLQEELWLEAPYKLGRACGRGARLFILRHAGREQMGREACGPIGLSGRAADVAAKLRVPSAKAKSTAVAQTEPAPMGVGPEQQRLTRQIFHRLSEMTASWERKTLAGFVDHYAEDVVVERPEGVLRGRKAVVEWAKHQQDWKSPGLSHRLALHQATMPPVQEGAFYETHELRWEEGGRQLRQTFSALWRNYGGLWLIAHEKVGPVKEVTERRPV